MCGTFGDAVVVDRDVAAVVDLDAGGVEARARRCWGSSRWRAGRGCPGPRGRRRSAPRRRRRRSRSMPVGPGALEQAHAAARGSSSSRAAATSGSFWGSTCWRLTMSVTSQPKRREHVHELDAGDARADDDQVLGQLGRRVGVAGGEHPLAVDVRPVGDAGPAAGGDAGWRRPRARSTPVGGLDDDLVRALEPGRCPGACARPGCSSRSTTEALEPGLDRRRCGAAGASKSSWAVAVGRGPCPRRGG